MNDLLFEKINLPEELKRCIHYFYEQDDWKMIELSDATGMIKKELYSEDELKAAYQRGIINKVQRENSIEYTVAGYDDRFACLIQCEPMLWNNAPKEYKKMVAAVMMNPATWLQQRLDALAAGYTGPETVSPVEEAIKLIENAEGIVTASACDCNMYLEGCDRDKSDVCIHVVPVETKINSRLDRGICKVVTKEEAVEIIKRTDREGLVHSLMGQGMCNCCTCCCYNLVNAGEYPIKDNLLLTPYRAYINEEKCIGCKACVKKCQFHALQLEKGIMHVNHDMCWGCGVCRVACKKDAIEMRKIR